jgi:hypothetical protein
MTVAICLMSFRKSFNVRRLHGLRRLVAALRWRVQALAALGASKVLGA